MGHFIGQRAWMSIEYIFNKQSGVIVGEYCNELISLQGDQEEYMDNVTVLYVCDGTTTHKCHCARVLLIYDPICNNLEEVGDALSTAKIFSQNVTFHGYYKHQYDDIL